MAVAHKSQFWRRCRIYFRRFRIAVWLLILFLLGSLIYVNQAGLPGFLKRPLLERLRARGIDLQFSRLRLGFYQGIVADEVRFFQTDEPSLPQVTASEVQVGLSFEALKRLQLQVDSLLVRKGRLIWTIEETNAPARHIAVENIQTYLRFLPGDQWALDNLTASFLGAKISLAGTVTNASAVRDWKQLQARQPAPVGLWKARMRNAADLLERIAFSSPPELRLSLRGDARDPQSFSVSLSVAAPGARTPWGDVAAGHFNGRLFPADSNGVSRAEISLLASNAQTQWAAVTNLHLQIRLTSRDPRTNVVVANLTLSAAQVRTKWAGGSNAVVSAGWTHALTNAVPLAGRGQVRCERVWTRWGLAGPVDFFAELGAPGPAEPAPRIDASWAWWTNIAPYALGWNARVANLRSPDLVATEITCGGTWRAPDLQVTNLHAALYAGRFSGHGALDVATRALRGGLVSNVDPKSIKPLLPEGARAWLDQFSWSNAPRVKGEVALVLPAWTNRQPDWRAEVQPALQLNGEFEIDGGVAHRGVQVDAVRARFSYSNQCWHLPELVVSRPEGRLVAEHRADERTKDFYWRLHSTVDAEALRPALKADQQKVFELLTFTRPPEVSLEIWGRSHEPARTEISGRIAVTNFTWRGEPVARLEATARYGNQVVQVFQPVVERTGAERASADGLTADFNQQLVFLTNGISSVDPMFIANAVGPQVARAIRDYHFHQPPAARVYGTIPMHGEEQADLCFELDGGPFDWWKFKLPHVSATVHWRGLALTLTNVAMDFYQGKAGGWAAFEFPRGKGTDYRFHVDATNTSLHELMVDLSSATNHLEGWLNASLSVTAGHDDDWQTVFGYGDANLREGLIWDLPLFGIFSPVLNGISPGLGNSRANAANCNYFITNGVVWSDDLEIRASAMRLQYRGAVDLAGNVNARAEAELLRDMWVVGPIVSTVLWPVTKMFEFKVKGTLNEPRMEPVYLIPKIILFPLHPLKTLKGLLPGEPTGTNAPAQPPAK